MKKDFPIPHEKSDRRLGDYRQWQYAECIDPNYPQLRNKAMPIISYELAFFSDTLIGVTCMLHAGHNKWFDIRQVRLYRGPSELLAAQHYRRTKRSLSKIFRSLGFSRT
jgi:hypothetical protein